MTTQTKALVPPDKVKKQRTLLGLIRDQRGAGMTEYIILVGVIALLAMAAFKAFGGSVINKTNEQAGKVDGIGT